MRRLKLTVMLCAALVAIGSYASRPKVVLCRGFLPKNNMRIPVGDVHALGLEENQFNKVLDRVEAVYAPIVAAHGGHLVINRLWDDATVNASAERDGDKWILNMYGGLARYKGVNFDGFALVACHELGHHLGGFPHYQGDWASNEGEADYHATLKCLRRVLGTKVANLDPYAKKRCEAVFKKKNDIAHCENGTMAGIDTAALLADLGGEPLPQLNTPDPTQVDQTNDDHPAAQCRLDTMFNGALCAKPVSEDLSDASPDPGACTEDQGYTVGLRPRCWYKPPEPPKPALVAHVSRKTVDTLTKRLKSLREQFGDGQGF